MYKADSTYEIPDKSKVGDPNHDKHLLYNVFGYDVIIIVSRGIFWGLEEKNSYPVLLQSDSLDARTGGPLIILNLFIVRCSKGWYFPNIVLISINVKYKIYFLFQYWYFNV